MKRFLREAKLASRLTHPNAVAVLDFGQTDDGLFYLVMELVVGPHARRGVRGGARAARPSAIIRIGMQVCDALEGAHALQIVHRDLKPSNIMLLDRGRDLVKVLDFGLAKSVAPDQTHDDDDERRRAPRHAGVHAAGARARRAVRWPRGSVLARRACCTCSAPAGCRSSRTRRTS